MRCCILYIAVFLCHSIALGQAGFKSDVTGGCGPLNVHFTDLTPKAAQWSWSFGNGNTSTTQNPSAIYTYAGNFTVTLTVKDSSGNSYTITKKGFITVFRNPTPAFVASQKKLCPGDSTNFSDQSSPGDTSISKWSWDFGDGVTSKLKNPTHTYHNPGYKNVSLVVMDYNGCYQQYTGTAFIIVRTPPTADFAIDTNFACRKTQKVNFSNASSPKNISFLWTFGDGTVPSTAQDPTHIYQKYGIFTVTLKIQDLNTNCYDTKSIPGAVILDSLNVDFDMLNKTLCDTSFAANFINKVPFYSSYSAKWDYGDGYSSTAWAAPHQYKNYGVYSVSLEIKGPNCKIKKTKINLVSVVQKPRTQIRVNDTGACGNPFTVKLIAKTPASASVTWDFGDYTTGKGTTVLHTYASGKDSFFVTAIALDKNTCKDTQKILATTNYLDVYALGTNEGCIPFSSKLNLITYKNTATTTKVEWYFNKKRIDSGNTCSYVFNDTGAFKVRLMVVNSKACIDTPDIFVYAGIRIKPSFTMSKDSICLGDSITFTNTTPKQKPYPQGFTWEIGEGGPLHGKTITYRYHIAQGKVNVMLIAKHFGCLDTAKSKDTLFVKSPRIQFLMPALGCTLPNPLPIINTTTTYTRFSWHTDPPEVSKSFDTIFVDGTKSSSFKLYMKAFNDPYGCGDSAAFDLKFYNNSPQALASFKLLKPCPPASMRFDDSGSTGSMLFWKMPNGDTVQSGKTVFFTADHYGVFYCTRVAVNPFPLQTCIDTFRIKIIIPEPDARFSISPAKGCTPLLSTLTDSAYQPGRIAWWKFGDTTLKSTTTSNPFTFNYPYDSLKKTVVFTAYDSFGRCYKQAAKTIEISGPKAIINTSPFYTCKVTKLQLDFTAQSKGIATWKWLADDTFLGNTANTEYIVYNARYVKVQLQITDSSGCTSIITKNVFVRVYKPDVKIQSDTSGAFCPPLVVHFFDKSTSFNNPIETWLWNFGDGSTSTLQNPTHTFLATGNYDITLKVKNFVGCFATKVFPLYIQIKGPVGSIVADVDTGCTPLKVNFYTTANALANVRWDFGDGFENTAVTTTHIYKTAGTYTPSAIMEDSAGCKIGVQANFAVKTKQSPVAKIDQLSFCENSMLLFADSTNYFSSPPKNEWSHYSGKASGKNFSINAKKGNPDSVHFIAFGNYGCNDTLHFKPRKSSILISLGKSKDTLCLGDNLQLADKSTSDTTIVNRQWYWQGNSFADSFLQTRSQIAGVSGIRFIAKNAFGCIDSFTSNNWVFTGDTAKPLASKIHYVTVTGDMSQRIVSMPFTIADWRQYNLYSTPPAIKILVHTNNKDTIFNTTGLDALHRSQCFLVTNTNICKKETAPLASLVHCTVNLSAVGDTNKVSLKWNAYIGSSIDRYVIYRKLPSQQNFIAIDSVPGGMTSYADTSIACSNICTYKLQAHLSGNTFVSASDTAMAIPIYKNRLGRPWITRVTVEPDKSVLLEFDPLRNPIIPLQYYTLEKSNDNISFTTLKKIKSGEPTWFMDADVKTDSVQYYYRINAIDVCNGQGPWSKISSNIVLRSFEAKDAETFFKWNAYRFWPGGVNRYELQQMNGSQQFYTVQTIHDTLASIYKPGSECGAQPIFRVVAFSNRNNTYNDTGAITSISNINILAGKPYVFVPNAFTPNTDNLNQNFKPSCYWVKNYTLHIYDRWGELLYKQTGCDASWNGTYKNEAAPDGMYVYRLEVTGSNDRKYYLQGSLALIR